MRYIMNVTGSKEGQNVKVTKQKPQRYFQLILKEWVMLCKFQNFLVLHKCECEYSLMFSLLYYHHNNLTVLGGTLAYYSILFSCRPESKCHWHHRDDIGSPFTSLYFMSSAPLELNKYWLFKQVISLSLLMLLLLLYSQSKEFLQKKDNNKMHSESVAWSRRRFWKSNQYFRKIGCIGP